MAQRSVSQTIDDDDCGSFIVVHRWSNEPNQQPNQPLEPIADDIVDIVEENEEKQEDNNNEDEDEQFSDAAADLDKTGSSETLIISPHSSIVENERQQQLEVSAGSTNNNPPMSHITTSVNQEGPLMMMDDERFSMTNYSTTSSSSATDQQLEDLQSKLSKVINDHRDLLDLLEKQNLELEQRKTTIEELKLLANESVLREKEKSDESRKAVEKMIGERDLAIQQLEVSKRNVPGSDVLETLENQLKQREDIIKQNNEQIIELSGRLHQEIVKREELSQALRVKEEEDKMKNDSLSNSDEALARSLSERESLQQAIEEAMKVKTGLQSEIAALKENLEVLTSENTRLHMVCDKLDAQYATIDTEGREMRIKLAALEAEKERQIEMYNQEGTKNATLEEEKAKLQRDLGRVNEMLQIRTNELHELQQEQQQQQAQVQGGGNPMNGSIVGNLWNEVGGLFKRNVVPPGARTYGMRDETDDPNEPYQQETFEHVGAHAMQQSNAAQPAVYQCPICLKRWTSNDGNLRKLEIHASNCGIDNAINTDPFVFP